MPGSPGRCLYALPYRAGGNRVVIFGEVAIHPSVAHGFTQRVIVGGIDLPAQFPQLLHGEVAFEIFIFQFGHFSLLLFVI